MPSSARRLLPAGRLPRVQSSQGWTAEGRKQVPWVRQESSSLYRSSDMGGSSAWQPETWKGVPLSRRQPVPVFEAENWQPECELVHRDLLQAQTSRLTIPTDLRPQRVCPPGPRTQVTQAAPRSAALRAESVPQETAVSHRDGCPLRLPPRDLGPISAQPLPARRCLCGLPGLSFTPFILPCSFGQARGESLTHVSLSPSIPSQEGCRVPEGMVGISQTGVE